MPASAAPYIGRFAPSPTGPLHAGSLLAAIASYLDAKANAGTWLLRIEDVDEHRTVSGAESDIKRTLEAHGLHWDREAPIQSSCTDRYQQVLNTLQLAGHTYYCNCPRKMLRQFGDVYPGTCRSKRNVDYHSATRQTPASHAIRFNTQSFDSTVMFNDSIYGEQSFQTSTLGDFVVLRRDSLFAYQLAVVSDDIDQGVTHVVRGADLLPSTPWQLMLFQALSVPPPQFAHLPLIVNANDGAKLSKQSGAKRVDKKTPLSNIINSLKMLGQDISGASDILTCEELLHHATQRWDIARVPTNPIQQTHTTSPRI